MATLVNYKCKSFIQLTPGQSTLFFFPFVSLKGAFLTFQCKIIAILLKVDSHFFHFLPLTTF